MKNYKTIYGLLVFGMLTGLASCKKGFEEINTPYKESSVATVSIPGLFNGIARSLTDEDNTLYLSLFYPITNQQGVQNIQAPFLNYTSSFWRDYYPSLYNYKALLKKISEQSNPQVFNNVKYMASIMMASKTLHMLDYYGDIPYSTAAKASDGTEFYRPTYDKQIDVYKSVLADLKAAADGISNNTDQTNISSSDSFLKNDLVAYRKFANALRLRYAVRLFGKEQALATEIISDVISGNKPLPNNQSAASLDRDNFGFWPSLVSPAIVTERQWYAFRETSVSNIRMGTNVWSQMSSNNNTDGSGIFDPRVYVYFQTNDANLWVPQPQDKSVLDGGSPYPNDNTKMRKPFGSDPNNKFSAFNYFIAYDEVYFPYLIITESDVHFLKAEIYQRGIGVAKNTTLAKTEYEAGITSSVNFWYAYTQNSPRWLTKPPVPTSAQITTMLNHPAVAYNGANDADALKKIITQAWLSTMFEPAEAWAIVRRTGLTPKDATVNNQVVNKLPYPDDENINNNANWKVASGGSTPTAQMLTKVYWMP
ncbi:SusD/RagB family nutrient-binding outer membrane lipoprotein [Pedobacter agri]|uniref:SusD/RagB family nutrient-binding outer membrane lipoprotein n=1 Tax=Pedobacter agri TaxID=454586 RepID=UPI00292D9713|nr:SusD/RagB family nutrient-binding outer membrane lipoprotein [Pedobacter agri]